MMLLAGISTSVFSKRRDVHYGGLVLKVNTIRIKELGYEL